MASLCRRVGRREVSVVADAVITEPCWKQVRTTLDQVQLAEMLRDTCLGLRGSLPKMLGGGEPEVSRGYMWAVVGARAGQQSGIRLPVEPSVVERPVGAPDEPGFARPAAQQPRIAYRTGFERYRCRVPHRGRIASCDIFMAQLRIEVIRDPRLQPVEIDVDEKRVAVGLDPRKRHWKQIG